ncbi:MAG: DUF99 family protein [Candidatus Bathyarchaeia archaeon]
MSNPRFRVIKPEIRVLGVDDGAFIPRAKGFVPIIGVVFRGGLYLDGVMHTKVEVDGLDATEKIVSMILKSPHYKQLRVIMLNGITIAGFNVVDVKKLNTKTRLPVIVVTRERPNLEEIYEALKKLPKMEERWKAILNAGRIIEASTRSETEKVYIQISGIHEDDAKKILHLTSTRSSIPEALRVAHIIASGISFDSGDID